MQISIRVSYLREPVSKESQCGTLLAALTHYRDTIKDDHLHYGAGSEEVVCQLNELIISVNDGMLFALESLEPLQIPDGNRGYKTVYEQRSEVVEGGAE